MKSVYSVYGTAFHLILDDKFAEAYNRALDAFIAAQNDFHQFHEEEWDPEKPLTINTSPEDIRAFNDFARLINFMKTIDGIALDIPEEEITSDYLVKL